MIRDHNKGFTLIELLIAVVVLAIIAAVGYPSYIEQVKKSRRGDAQAALLELSQFMEKFYSSNSCYQHKGADGLCSTSSDNSDPTLPFTQSPKQGTTKYYNLALRPSTDATRYTLRATPITGSSQDGDGWLEITNTGLTRWDKDNDGSTGESRW